MDEKNVISDETLHEILMKECLAYFRARPVYEKVFRKIWDKAISLGHFGGSVTFPSLSVEEKEQLEGFFQKSFRKQKSVTISAVLMQKALDDSRFSGLAWVQVLEQYFEEPLIGRKERKRQQEGEQKRFFQQFFQKDDAVRLWLKKLLEDGSCGGQMLMRSYRDDESGLRTALWMVIRAANDFPTHGGQLEMLPVFSARITGNPHFFDEGTLAGRLLEMFLTDQYPLMQEDDLAPAERKSRLLYQAGILKDDLSNFTLAYGIQGRRRDGLQHEGLAGFWQMREPVQCTLMTLGSLEDVWGNSDIYVVENPSVFSVLMKRSPQATLVCTNGQPRLASLVLLDFLSRHGNLWYAGDFDPEGLVIAQNLKRRYGERLKFWEYRKELYEKALSAVVLEEWRLKKLQRIQEEELLELAEEMVRVKRAAYQEAMLDAAYFLPK